MKLLTLIIIMIFVIFSWSGFKEGSLIATTGEETSIDIPATNFTGANLEGANLTGVSLQGVILCNTTMPDGSINNSNCIN